VKWVFYEKPDSNQIERRSYTLSGSLTGVEYLQQKIYHHKQLCQ